VPRWKATLTISLRPLQRRTWYLSAHHPRVPPLEHSASRVCESRLCSCTSASGKRRLFAFLLILRSGVFALFQLSWHTRAEQQHQRRCERSLHHLPSVSSNICDSQPPTRNARTDDTPFSFSLFSCSSFLAQLAEHPASTRSPTKYRFTLARACVLQTVRCRLSPSVALQRATRKPTVLRYSLSHPLFFSPFFLRVPGKMSPCVSDDEEAMGSDDASNASYMSEGEGSGGQTSEEDNDDHGYGRPPMSLAMCQRVQISTWSGCTKSRVEGSKYVGRRGEQYPPGPRLRQCHPRTRGAARRVPLLRRCGGQGQAGRGKAWQILHAPTS